ncbi:MAG TPA: hypothetical protein VN653_12840 [Anaerolineales bacterium]|jgi:hypothetical protein|nr:hypothetical protein [Anaerolineales bacterium]
MNLRCAFCQTPFAIGRQEILAALQHLETENLTHYDAHCPRCQRATRVQKQKLELAFPNWRDALHELEQQAEVVPAPAADLPSAPTQKAESMPAHAKHHRSRAGAKAKEAAAAAAAKPASKGKRDSATKKKGK